MIYDSTSKLDCLNAIEYLKKIISRGKKFELLVKHPKRSIEQNKYFHLILTWFGIETGYTLAEVKQEILKKIVCPEIFYDGEFGDKVKIERFRSTASLNTYEMKLVIDRFRNWSSIEFNIYLPDAEKEKKAVEQLEIEISKHKNQEFI